ncbi:hypothetical protein F4781DRAFT_433879 [Annulohypoxylon bovei var. microspora]|nr:hypothetical protein F4781DRAFT_433879 [Annulohypoxylon bovei var. microspora]
MATEAVSPASSTAASGTATSSQKRTWYHSTLFNAVVIGAVGFAPGLWNAMSNLGAGGAQEPYLVNAANSLVFAIMGFLCLLGAPLANRVGLPRTLFLGAAGYPVYSAGLYANNRYGNVWLVLVGAVACGFSAGLFWAAYFNQYSGNFQAYYFGVRARALVGFLSNVGTLLSSQLVSALLDYKRLAVKRRVEIGFWWVVAWHVVAWTYGWVVQERYTRSPPALPRRQQDGQHLGTDAALGYLTRTGELRTSRQFRLEHQEMGWRTCASGREYDTAVPRSIPVEKDSSPSSDGESKVEEGLISASQILNSDDKQKFAIGKTSVGADAGM